MSELREIEVAARSLQLLVQAHEARDPADFLGAFSAMARDRCDALTTIGGNTYFTHREKIAELALQRRLPSIFVIRQYVDAGGLMAYGQDIREYWRRAASYVDKILKGAKPADLPVERTTVFHFVINLRTAAALGLSIPPTLLQRADEVIR